MREMPPNAAKILVNFFLTWHKGLKEKLYKNPYISLGSY